MKNRRRHSAGCAASGLGVALLGTLGCASPPDEGAAQLSAGQSVVIEGFSPTATELLVQDVSNPDDAHVTVILDWIEAGSVRAERLGTPGLFPVTQGGCFTIRAPSGERPGQLRITLESPSPDVRAAIEIKPAGRGCASR